jgi:hypothetical protein
MTTTSTFAIVGGGLAGAKAAEALRDKDFDGHEHPPLSKEYLALKKGLADFTTFWVDGDDRVLAGMNVNVWEGLDDIKSLIRSRAPLGAA